MIPLKVRDVAREESARPEPRFTRRQLLTRGVLATSGIAFGSLVLRYVSLARSRPAPGRLVLSEDDEAMTRALLSAMFPKGAELPPADASFILPRIDRYLAGADSEIRLLYRAMLRAIEDQSIFFHLRRFTRLSPQAQASEVRAWELTPIYLKGMAFKSTKLVIGMAYFEQPDVREAMGWYLGCSPVQLRGPAGDGSGLG